MKFNCSDNSLKCKWMKKKSRYNNLRMNYKMLARDKEVLANKKLSYNHNGGQRYNSKSHSYKI